MALLEQREVNKKLRKSNHDIPLVSPQDVDRLNVSSERGGALTFVCQKGKVREQLMSLRHAHGLKFSFSQQSGDAAHASRQQVLRGQLACLPEHQAKQEKRRQMEASLEDLLRELAEGV